MSEQKSRGKKPGSESESSFEALYTLLEEKARRLEQGNLPLEDSIRLYEEGAALVERLREILDGAQLRVERVRGRLEQDRNDLREIESGYDADGDD